MEDLLQKVCLGTIEVATSSVVGASVLSPIPPLALLMLPVCAIGSLVSIATNEIFNKLLNVDDKDVGMRLATKSISLLIGATVAAAITAVVLLPISLEAALVIGTVIALSCIIGAITAAIIKEGPEIYSNGFHSYSLNIGYSPSYTPYYSRPSVFLPRGRIGLPARGFGRTHR